VTGMDAVNLDTSGATGFVAEGSPVRVLLKNFVAGRPMLMCMSAQTEFLNAVAKKAGITERARATRFLKRVTIVPDAPSARIMALWGTKRIRNPDRIIFGTGDALGIVTVTSDGRFVRAAAGQGLILSVFLHPPGRFQGK
jgi:Protein of unknown function (DUF1308)